MLLNLFLVKIFGGKPLILKNVHSHIETKGEVGFINLLPSAGTMINTPHWAENQYRIIWKNGDSKVKYYFAWSSAWILFAKRILFPKYYEAYYCSQCTVRQGWNQRSASWWALGGGPGTSDSLHSQAGSWTISSNGRGISTQHLNSKIGNPLTSGIELCSRAASNLVPASGIVKRDKGVHCPEYHIFRGCHRGFWKCLSAASKMSNWSHLKIGGC